MSNMLHTCIGLFFCFYYYIPFKEFYLSLLKNCLVSCLHHMFSPSIISLHILNLFYILCLIIAKSPVFWLTFTPSDLLLLFSDSWLWAHVPWSFFWGNDESPVFEVCFSRKDLHLSRPQERGSQALLSARFPPDGSAGGSPRPHWQCELQP